MSHCYPGQHIHSSRPSAQDKIHYQRLPTFDLNSRVKLPPIIKNELLTGCDKKTSLQPSTRPTMTTPSASVCFPTIIGTQPSRNWNQNGIPSQKIRSPNKPAPVKTTIVNHVEKPPINFPNSYTVLPPIGQTSSWPHSGFSTLQASPRNGEQAPIIVPDQVGGRRRQLSQRKRSENGLAPTLNGRQSVKGRPERIKSLPTPTTNTLTNSIAVEHTCEKALFLSGTTSRKTDEENTTISEDVTCLSSEDVEMSEFNPIHELEKLELSTEAEEFLESKNSRRRGAKCIEIDPSLKAAVDIIRDNLLRQTMEELCMMW